MRNYCPSAAALLFCLSGAALAQSNEDNDVRIDQIGTDNSAIITQAGQRNLAGSAAQTMIQNGIFNTLSIQQTGQDNTIGLADPGVFQFGQQNSLTTFNSIDVIQNSNGNTVGSIYQSSLGSIVNGSNRLSITQQGGDTNTVARVLQVQEAGQAGQSAAISQTGQNNFIDRVEQRSNDTGREGINEIDVTILGSNNGRVGLSGFAAEPGAADSSILQQADTVDPGVYGNKIQLDIIGDDNRFGLRQGGRMNDMGRLLINGSQNQLGLRQDGTENNIQIAAIEGDSNEIGIDQIVTNIASVDLIGLSDDNRIFAFQQGTNAFSALIAGDRNTLRSRQDYLSGTGGQNDAVFSVTGDDNFADLVQFGSNLFDLTITGDRNNAVGALAGTAALTGLIAGYFSQQGTGNTMILSVTGADNNFAASQTGTDNTVYQVTTGDLNQAAFVQVGSVNIASLVQTGNGNSAAFFQY